MPTSTSTTTSRWTRWQDWTVLTAGVVLALTPLWFNPGETGKWWMIVVGGAMAVTSFWSLALPEDTLSEWIHTGLGVLAFASPWLFGYAGTPKAAWTAWAVGAIALVLGLWTIPRTAQLMRHVTVRH
jgi:hypothetical protein